MGLSEADFLHSLLKHAAVAKFDLLAVRPQSEAILAALSGKPGIDILTLDVPPASPPIKENG